MVETPGGQINIQGGFDFIEVKPGANITGVVLTANVIKDLTISGHVHDAQGKPVVKAPVRVGGPMVEGYVDSKGGGLGGIVFTSEDGAYEFGYLREGNYNVEVLRGATQEYAEQKQEGVPAGSNGVDFVLGPASSISGRVIRADTGAPLTTFEVGKIKGSYSDFGSLVAMGESADCYLFLEDFNNSEGHFAIESPYREAITVIARAEGFAPATQVVSPPPKGAPAEEVILRLEPTVQVRGVVRDTEGKPVTDAQIFVDVLPPKRSRDEGGVPRTDKDGAFVIKAIPNREQTIFATHPKYALGMTVVTPSSSAAQPVEIILQQGGRIEGIVTRDGEPVERAWIMLMFGESWDQARISEQDERNTFTGSDGTYVFERAPENASAVRCMSYPGRSCVRNDTKEVQVRNGETATVDFNLPSTGSVVQGVVTIDGQSPRNVGVKIIPESPSDATEITAYIRGNVGHYEAPDLPPGPISLEVIAYFGNSVEATPQTLATESFTIGEGEVIEKNFQLTAP